MNDECEKCGFQAWVGHPDRRCYVCELTTELMLARKEVAGANRHVTYLANMLHDSLPKPAAIESEP